MRSFPLICRALLLSLAITGSGCGSDPDPGPGPGPDPLPEGAISVDVTGVFEVGARLVDAYSGQTVEVGSNGAAIVVPDASGVVLLEREQDATATPPFTWDNATVYFAMTDRFANGRTSNDAAYGRTAAAGEVVGTWHGGDFAGMTARLDHLDALGVNALWLSFPVEQIHGWVGGGDGDFQHFAYHGYWPLDFTRIDESYGTVDELRTLIDAAHARGIRVLFDVVMNHSGYAALDDLATLVPGVLKPGWDTFTRQPGDSWHDFNDFIEFGSFDWSMWWGPAWIRSNSFPNHFPPGNTDQTRQVAFLPDFRTEIPAAVEAPPLFDRKPDTGVTDLPNASVRQYLVKWLTDWVRELGVDGFRVDTAKHVELESWVALKEEATAALAEWKAANPGEALDDLPFWMTGEVFPHGVVKDAYFTEGGFDSLINFDFQREAEEVSKDRVKLEARYADYAARINTDPDLEVLSYISSHDTSLYFDDIDESVADQVAVGTAFLLLPGGVQIFYGDESGRRAGPTVSDPQAQTRSDMNWESMDPQILAHWQKLGTFRRRHPAVGAGAHEKLGFAPGYAFSRKLGTDAVVVVLTK